MGMKIPLTMDDGPNSAPHNGQLGASTSVGATSSSSVKTNNNEDNNPRTQYSIPGILHYIQHEWARFEMERSQWDVERAEFSTRSVLKTRNCFVRKQNLIFVDPGGGGRDERDQFLGFEPQSDFLVGALDGVRSVHDVPADLDAEVSEDGARFRVSGVGLAQHDAAGLDHVQTFPDHADNGAGCHVLDQSREKL